jgi:hypothetical protein
MASRSQLIAWKLLVLEFHLELIDLCNHYTGSLWYRWHARKGGPLELIHRILDTMNDLSELERSMDKRSR